MIEVSAEGIERASSLLAGIPGGAESALKIAISKGQSTLRSETASGITKIYKISRANLQSAKNVKLTTKSGSGYVIGTVLYSGTKLPLYRYDISHYAVYNGKNRKLLSARKMLSSARKEFPGAFIACMKNGHLGIFERTKDKIAYPIKEVMGDSVAQMAENSDVRDAVETETANTINSEIDSAIATVLDKWEG